MTFTICSGKIFIAKLSLPLCLKLPNCRYWLRIGRFWLRKTADHSFQVKIEWPSPFAQEKFLEQSCDFHFVQNCQIADTDSDLAHLAAEYCGPPYMTFTIWSGKNFISKLWLSLCLKLPSRRYWLRIGRFGCGILRTTLYDLTICSGKISIAKLSLQLCSKLPNCRYWLRIGRFGCGKRRATLSSKN